MADVMIGTDPHKSSHTAVAIGRAEERLGELQVRACPSQAGQLLAWAAGWPGGLGMPVTLHSGLECARMPARIEITTD